jgi:hypothetical protein
MAVIVAVDNDCPLSIIYAIAKVPSLHPRRVEVETALLYKNRQTCRMRSACLY